MQREWLVGILVIVLIAIVLDGVRRWRISRYTNIRMRRGLHNKAGNDETPNGYGNELPGGGARVVGQRDANDAARVNQNVRTVHESSKPQGLKSRLTEQTSLDLGEAVPLLMESVSKYVSSRKEQEEKRTPIVGSETEQSSAEADSIADAEMDDMEPELGSLDVELETAESVGNKQASNALQENDDQDSQSELEETPYKQQELTESESDPVEDVRAAELAEAAKRETVEAEIEAEKVKAEKIQTEQIKAEKIKAEQVKAAEIETALAAEKAQAEAQKQLDEEKRIATEIEQQPNPLAAAEEFIAINIMASQGALFSGKDLRDTVLACGLRYGAMKIFHRTKHDDGSGDHWFCMTNVIEPGNFDLSNIESLQTPGVCLLMGLPCAEPIKAFDNMMETALVLSEKLNGELKDDQRSVLTRQTIEHTRQRIQDFQRKQLTKSS